MPLGLMYRTLLLSLLLCMAAPGTAFAGSHAEASEQDANWMQYRVNPGDILIITVWKEEDLSRRVTVRPDGAFSFPLIGDIRAQQQTVDQVRQLVADKLTQFIPDPVVTVQVEEIRGNKVYVIGQVNRPGEFMATSNVDVVQALSYAGGMTAFADLNSIKILRRINGKLIALRFDYRDIEKGKKLEQNIVLQPGDVVLVP